MAYSLANIQSAFKALFTGQYIIGANAVPVLSALPEPSGTGQNVYPLIVVNVKSGFVLDLERQYKNVRFITPIPPADPDRFGWKYPRTAVKLIAMVDMRSLYQQDDAYLVQRFFELIRPEMKLSVMSSDAIPVLLAKLDMILEDVTTNDDEAKRVLRKTMRFVIDALFEVAENGELPMAETIVNDLEVIL